MPTHTSMEKTNKSRAKCLNSSITLSKPKCLSRIYLCTLLLECTCCLTLGAINEAADKRFLSCNVPGNQFEMLWRFSLLNVSIIFTSSPFKHLFYCFQKCTYKIRMKISLIFIMNRACLKCTHSYIPSWVIKLMCYLQVKRHRKLNPGQDDKCVKTNPKYNVASAHILLSILLPPLPPNCDIRSLWPTLLHT